MRKSLDFTPAWRLLFALFVAMHDNVIQCEGSQLWDGTMMDDAYDWRGKNGSSHQGSVGRFPGRFPTFSTGRVQGPGQDLKTCPFPAQTLPALVLSTGSRCTFANGLGDQMWNLNWVFFGGQFLATSGSKFWEAFGWFDWCCFLVANRRQCLLFVGQSLIGQYRTQMVLLILPEHWNPEHWNLCWDSCKECMSASSPFPNFGAKLWEIFWQLEMPRLGLLVDLRSSACGMSAVFRKAVLWWWGKHVRGIEVLVWRCQYCSCFDQWLWLSYFVMFWTVGVYMFFR